MNQININSNLNVDDIAEASIQTAQTAYKENIQITWNSLQIAARQFLKDMVTLSIEEQRQQAMIFNTVNADTIASVTTSTKLPAEQLITKHQFTKQKYKLAFAFDDKVTQFRGLAPKQAVFVYYANNRISSFIMPLENLLNLIDINTGRMTKVNISKLRAEGGKKLEEDKNGFPNKEHVKQVQTAYMGVKNRMHQFLDRVKKAGLQANTDNTALLMWKEQNRFWTVARVTSYGDVKEAYINALLQKHEHDLLCSDPAGSPKFYDHALIRDFFTNFIQQVGPTPAVVEEDIVTQNGQYAVKSSGASLPGLQQYIEVAELITSIKGPGGLTGQQLDAAIREKYKATIEAKARNTIIGNIQHITNRELGPLLNDIGRQDALINIYH